MNTVHAAVIKHIRSVFANGSEKSAEYFLSLKDDQMMRLMFSSVRNDSGKTRGMRLTNSGLEIMKSCFQFFDVPREAGLDINNNELLYLDRRAKLPYYIDASRVVVFESDLGMLLKLADGSIHTLMQIDSSHRNRNS